MLNLNKAQMRACQKNFAKMLGLVEGIRKTVKHVRRGRFVKEVESTIDNLTYFLNRTAWEFLAEEGDNILLLLSHEFGTALTETLATAYIQADSIAGVRQLQDHLETVQGIIEAVRSIVTGKKLNSRIINLTALTSELAADLGRREGRAIFLPLPQSFYVWGHKQALRMSLGNLIKNAVKYSSDYIDLDISRVDANGGIYEGYTGIWVRDHGKGIIPQHIDNIWEIGYRVSGTKGIEGQGIGLHVVRTLVESQEGHVGVESTVGKGSTFYIYLPPVRRSSYLFPWNWRLFV